MTVFSAPPTPDCVRVFIGKDDNETVAYHTLVESIIAQSTRPVAIHPVYKPNLKRFYEAEKRTNESTDFSMTRFLVPYLCNYNGWAIFMDCDMILRGDISELWDMKDTFKAVQVVKHDYEPMDEKKFLGATQHKYPKKNWSSVMLMNCGHFHSRRLTPASVLNNGGKWLHQFEWTEDDRVGEFGMEWNHLADEYEYNDNAKIVHFTRGTPCWSEYRNSDYADEWYYWREQAFKFKPYGDPSDGLGCP